MKQTMEQSPNHHWCFLTNHALVLLCIDRNRNIRLRDIAKAVGITPRSVQKIVYDLDIDGYVSRFHEGRRNHYRVNRSARLRHPLVRHVTVGDLLDTLASVPLAAVGSAGRRLAF